MNGKTGISQRPKKRSCEPMNRTNRIGAGTSSQHEPALVAPQAHGAADRGDQRHATEAPGEGPQVVRRPLSWVRPSLPARPRRRRLVARGRPGTRRSPAPRTGWPRRRRRAPRRRASAMPRAAARPPSGRRPLRARGGDQRQQHDPAGVLRRARQAEPDAGHGVVAPPAEAQHARDAPQRQADRRQRRHVVERQVRVEDRQEGDREASRRRAARCGGRPAARPARYSSQTATRPQQRGEHARDDQDLGRVRREGVRHALAPPEPDREHDVQQVRVGGRVDEVVRVPVVAEEPDRAWVMKCAFSSAL